MSYDHLFHNLRLVIDYVPITALLPCKHNPRVHPPRQIKALAKSISSFGCVVPLIIDADNRLIGGHARLEAAQRAGLRDVPVVRIEHLDAQQRRALMIADNRLTDMSTWDDRLLAENLKLLVDVNLDFELEATGFTMGEIDLRIEGLTVLPEDDPDDAIPSDAIPSDTLPGPPVTIVGDLWQLGAHRLLCGDARDGGSWARLMAGKKAAMTCSDFPYNVQISGHVSGLGRICHREFPMASGEMDKRGFTDFLSQTFAHMVQHSKPGSLHYVLTDWRHLGEMQAAGDGVFSALKNVCVWDKGRGGMGSLYRSQHELIFVWKAGKAPHRNNVELGRYGRNRSNVWAYPGIGGFRHSDEGDLLALHPTVKPVRMIADAILDVTGRGDIVTDPFLGSGTTIIAAERIGRRCYAMELDPLYVDTAIQRFERHSGIEAVHAASGLSFAALAAQRAACRSKEAAHG